MSLVELLVAVALLSIGMLVGLRVYQDARESYKRGEDRSEQQQIARIAFDLISREIRVAGLNVYPDGDKTRPDEAIEAAYERALVIRADFDGEDATDAATPETSLTGGAYATVSTGNDEIHGFVLAKSLPDGTASGTDHFTFDADVAQPHRDGGVETVDVGNVSLTLDDPPYTLYRIALDNNPAKFGTPGFVNRTVLADNIRSLRFRYFDRGGNEITPPGGDDTPAAINARAGISRVTVEVETLTRNPDPRTKSFETFELASQVTPRNQGKIHIPDIRSTPFPPGQPATPEVLDGHCGGLLVRWPPNPSYDQVEYYRIRYGTDPFALDGAQATMGTELYLSSLDDGVDYTVKLEAVNRAGTSHPSAPVTRRTSNLNTPESPGGLSGASDPGGGIALAWDAVTRNTVMIPDDQLRDLAGYRLYRGTSSGLTPDPAKMLADEGSLPALSTPGFEDRQTVNCRSYHYLVTAVDSCGVESAPSGEIAAAVTSTTAPRAPRSALAFLDGAEIRLTWDRVQDDVTGAPTWIEDYRVYRTAPLPARSLPPGPGSLSLLATVHAGTEYRDAPPPPGSRYWYAVKAFDDCGNESVLSPITTPTCSFNGDVEVVEPAFGTRFWPSGDVRVQVLGASGTYDRLRLSFVNELDATSYSSTLAGPGPQWTYTMLGPGAGPFTSGWYTITAEVDQYDGTTTCTNSATLRLQLADE